MCKISCHLRDFPNQTVSHQGLELRVSLPMSFLSDMGVSSLAGQPAPHSSLAGSMYNLITLDPSFFDACVSRRRSDASCRRIERTERATRFVLP